eukprot:CFRG7528T1
MMVRNAIKETWAMGRVATSAWLMVGHPTVAELVARTGYTTAVIDLQHGMLNLPECFSMIQAIRAAGVPPMVRLASNDPAQISKVLDHGAMGVICPLINTAAQSDAFVRSCHYPPEGDRSFGAVVAGNIIPKYHRTTRDSIVTMAMVETKEGLENLDEILKTDNLDGIFVGPSDLAISLGCEPQANPENPIVLDALATIVAKTRGAGKRVGVYVGSGEYARLMVDMGFDIVAPGADIGHLLETVQAQLEDLKKGRTNLYAK